MAHMQGVPPAAAIIVAAGRGRRMESETPKQFLMLGNRPVLAHTLAAIDRAAAFNAIYLVVSDTDMAECRKQVLSHLSLSVPVHLVAGGVHRKDSVHNGLLAVEGAGEIVAIHDGVRPFVRPGDVRACVAEAARTGAGILAIPIRDTLKQVADESVVTATVPRDGVWAALTPQAFRYDVILAAHRSAAAQDAGITDDAQLVERLGQPVSVVIGSRFNIKITTPEDLALARALLTAGLV